MKRRKAKCEMGTSGESKVVIDLAGMEQEMDWFV